MESRGNVRRSVSPPRRASRRYDDHPDRQERTVEEALAEDLAGNFLREAPAFDFGAVLETKRLEMAALRERMTALGTEIAVLSTRSQERESAWRVQRDSQDLRDRAGYGGGQKAPGPPPGPRLPGGSNSARTSGRKQVFLKFDQAKEAQREARKDARNQRAAAASASAAAAKAATLEEASPASLSRQASAVSEGLVGIQGSSSGGGGAEDRGCCWPLLGRPPSPPSFGPLASAEQASAGGSPMRSSTRSSVCSSGNNGGSLESRDLSVSFAADDSSTRRLESADDLAGRMGSMDPDLSADLSGPRSNSAALSEEEVRLHARKHRSHHSRRLEDSRRLKVLQVVKRDRVVHLDPHEETFFELFYDLIVVVVFIKLGYLKNDFSLLGLMTVSSIFANFWSCWSLMNLYATMLHTEDLLHRLYYVAHIFTSFLMAVAIDHPDHTFFAHREMAWYLSASSLLCRLVTLGMWLHASGSDLGSAAQSGITKKESLFAWKAKAARRQCRVHALSILAACLLLAAAMLHDWDFG